MAWIIEAFESAAVARVQSFWPASGDVEYRGGVVANPPQFIPPNTAFDPGPTNAPHMTLDFLYFGNEKYGARELDQYRAYGYMQFDIYVPDNTAGSVLAQLLGRIDLMWENHGVAGLHTYGPIPRVGNPPEGFAARSVDVSFEFFHTRT